MLSEALKKLNEFQVRKIEREPHRDINLTAERQKENLEKSKRPTTYHMQGILNIWISDFSSKSKAVKDIFKILKQKDYQPTMYIQQNCLSKMKKKLRNSQIIFLKKEEVSLAVMLCKKN